MILVTDLALLEDEGKAADAVNAVLKPEAFTAPGPGPRPARLAVSGGTPGRLSITHDAWWRCAASVESIVSDAHVTQACSASRPTSREIALRRPTSAIAT